MLSGDGGVDSGDAAERERIKRRRRRPTKKDRVDGKDQPPSPPLTPTPVPVMASAPTRTPIILAKPSHERPSSHEAASPVKHDKPVVMLKSREETRERQSSISSSAVQSIPSLLAGDGLPSAAPTPSYQIQRHLVTTPQAPQTGEGSSIMRLAGPPEMSQSLKLVDDTLTWCEAGMEVLLDQTDFFVVGAIGLQGCGKSTLLSMLADDHYEPGRLLEHPEVNKELYFASAKGSAFRVQSSESGDLGGHQTNGIDMFVTGERLVLLDTQPMLSASALDNMIHHDKKYPTEYSSAENCIFMQSLQRAAFLLTVCNVVLVVLDWFVDMDVIRFLQTAEMLKPPTPSTGQESSGLTEDCPEYYPHVVFVLTRAKREDFSVENMAAMQATIARLMDSSKLKYRGTVTMATGKLMPGLNSRTIQNDVNLFLLPEEERGDEDGIYSMLPQYQGHPGMRHLLTALRNQLFGLPRCLLTHTTLSEKNWFHYAARTWDSVKKSQLMAEYNRLLP